MMTANHRFVFCLPRRAALVRWALAAALALPALAATAAQGEAGATTLEADRSYGQRLNATVFEGDVRLQHEDMRLRADELVYDELRDHVQAQGNVKIEQNGAELEGERADITLYSRQGEIDRPRYHFAAQQRSESTAVVLPGGGGEAEKLWLDGENHYRMQKATWSSCPAPDPDWYLRLDKLTIDRERNVGEASGSTLVFHDVPILWWPWARFPLTSERQSGVLTPTLGLSNKTGADISVPYYWNIAPNYDATLTTRLMSRRGVQLGGQYRYLSRNFGYGEANVQWLPKDRSTGKARGQGSWRHQQSLTPALSAAVDINAVTDDAYFEDLSSQVEGSSLTHLLRQGSLNYNGGWWSAAALAQSWQSLGAANRAEAPYQRLPQFSLRAARNDVPAGGRFVLQGEYSRFRHKNQARAEGARSVLYPQLRWPLKRIWGFVTPKLGWHYSRYKLNRQPLAAGRRDIVRSLPVLSVDSGLFFDRNTRLFGRPMRQTLEPRLFYVYVPWRQQDDIPLFDSARHDFGMTQIFSENRYSGSDRLADANQITAALTTRLIDSRSGIERLRATLGQRYYFSDRRVFLPGERRSDKNRSDLLAALRANTENGLSFSAAVQYNIHARSAERFHLHAHYQPAPAHAVNVGYRFTRDELRDVDFSMQWPLAGNWYGVGRVTRSVLENRTTEALGGLEYNGGCWQLRTALHRFATNPQNTTNAIFVQLELSGLGSIGNSPISLLRRSVPGYGRIGNTAPGEERYLFE